MLPTSIAWMVWIFRPAQWCWSEFPPPGAGVSATPTAPGSSGCPIPDCNAPGAGASKGFWRTNCFTPGFGLITVTRAMARFSKVTPQRAAFLDGVRHSVRFAARGRNNWRCSTPGRRRHWRARRLLPGFRRPGLTHRLSILIQALPTSKRASLRVFAKFRKNSLRFDIGNGRR